MFDNRIDQALGDISDVYLESAMGVYERKRKGRRIKFRLIACAVAVALLLTAAFWPASEGSGESGILSVPGVMKVYACEWEEDMDYVQLEKYELLEGGEPSYHAMWCPFSDSTGDGILLTLLVSDESLLGYDITFDVTTNYGELRAHKEYAMLGKEGTLGNGEMIYWTCFELLHQNYSNKEYVENVISNEGVYVDIIVRANGNIVGYALLEMCLVRPDSFVFASRLKDTVFFPKVDGQFQKITKEYVVQQLSAKKAHR